MSWWVVPPPLADGETVLWHRAASQPQRIRLVGGRVFLTPYRLIFQPNRLEAAAGAIAWSAGLHEIVAVGPEPGLRRKLRIDLRNGAAGRFFLTKLDRTGQELVARVNALRN
jgi:hypothetical protein